MRSLPLGARLVVLLAALTLTINLAWALILPFGWGDDEPTHVRTYQYFARSLELPIITQDRGDVFFHEGGAIFSYVAYPPLPYLPTAATLRILDIDDQDASIAVGRAWSIVWVSVAVLAIYAATRRLVPGIRGPHAAFWAGAVAALLPKMGEIGGYANSDSMTIAAAAVLAWITIVAHQKGWTAWWSAGVAVSVVALLFTRYNAYFVVLPTVLFVAYSWATTRRPALRSLVLMTGIVLALWGWWPVRNLLLYGEPTAVATLYAGLAERNTSFPVVSDVFQVEATLAALVRQTPWVHDVWASIWLGEKAGGQGVWLWLITGIFLTVGGYSAWHRARSRIGTPASAVWPLGVGLVLATVLTGFLGAYSVIEYGYQSKGRYLIPLIPLGVVLLSYAISTMPKRPRVIATLVMPIAAGGASIAYAVGFYTPVALLKY